MKQQQLLGKLLQQAYLVSPHQVQDALTQQSQEPKTRIGEILAQRGWLKQETADFFAEQWQPLVEQAEKLPEQPLGYYLQKAGLLDDTQIAALLNEQEEGRLWMRLGASAVLKGWLNQGTVDFFLSHLYPNRVTESPFVRAKSS